MLPLDPPARPGSTVGGLVATGSAGPLRLGFGTPRDHILGLQIVTGDGRMLDIGGRVVKNVAGYDLVRLAVGSRGTLGFITRASIRLRPVPAADFTIVSPAAGGEDAVERGGAIMERILPGALEIVCPRSAGEMMGGGGWHVVARLLGNADAVAESARRVAEAVDGEVETLDARHAATFWQNLADAQAAAIITIRFANHPSELADLMRLALRTLAAIEPGAADGGAPTGAWRLAAHAGDGIVRLWRRAARALPPGHFGDAIARARDELAPVGGTVLVPVAPAGSLDGVPAFGDPPAAVVTERLRKAFDPAGILARGRFLACSP
jgi:glycolate oxidase FAD binding subunit